MLDVHDVLSICIVDASERCRCPFECEALLVGGSVAMQQSCIRMGRVPTLVGNVSEVVGSFPKGELLVFFAWRRGKFMLC